MSKGIIKGIITVFLWIIPAALILISVLSLFEWGADAERWMTMSGIAIGTFILSLVCMNYLTSKSKKEGIEFSLVKKKIDEIEKGIKRLKKERRLDSRRDLFDLLKSRFKRGRKKGSHSCGDEKLKNSIKEEIGELIKFLISLSKMVGEDDSLICEEIIDKLGKIEELLKAFEVPQETSGNATRELTPQQFDNKKKELNGIINSLRVYIDSISTPEGILLSEIDKAIDDCEKTIGQLESDKEKNADAIVESRKKKIKLRDKKIEVVSKEPEGVLDKHEIRRSLTLSLTIVYFMLLFFSIFSPVTTTTQFINMTGMSPENITGNITGNITLGCIESMATKANITLSNITLSDITLSRKTEHRDPNLESPFIEIFTYVYLAVIAFYFGSRAIETYTAMKKK